MDVASLVSSCPSLLYIVCNIIDLCHTRAILQNHCTDCCCGTWCKQAKDAIEAKGVLDSSGNAPVGLTCLMGECSVTVTNWSKSLAALSKGPAADLSAEIL